MTKLTPARAAKIIARSKLPFDDVLDTRAYRSPKQEKLSAMMRLLIVAFASGKMVLRSVEDLSGDLYPDIRDLVDDIRAFMSEPEFIIFPSVPIIFSIRERRMMPGFLGDVEQKR